jgi:hypothetical protein
MKLTLSTRVSIDAIALQSDFWEYTPGVSSSSNAAGTWRQITPVGNFTPPPISNMMSAFDESDQSLYVWHGQYEEFTRANPEVSIWIYRLYVLNSVPNERV